ncbi:MAG TPA: FAD:protein FMN transferase [Amnibacterium sp.]|nr:FAD:protein FMN transferase [Amnibacterium sp.]
MTIAQRTWPVWSTTAEVLVTRPAALDAACALAQRRLEAVSDACDRFRADSETSRLRDRAADGVRVSPVLAGLVRVALEAARLSDGAVDPTLGAPLRSVGYDRDIRLVPDDGRPIGAVGRPLAAWEQVHVSGDLLVVPDGVELDLGATAKAAAADAIAETIADRFGCGALVNLGGDLSARGPAPAGGWQVLVQDLPRDPASHVSLAEGWAIATSSTQRRTWRRGDGRAHHILDPRSGLPGTPVWRTVSVAASSAVRANTLATAAVVRGPAAGALLHTARTPARLVDAARSVTLLNGWPENADAAAA